MEPNANPGIIERRRLEHKLDPETEIEVEIKNPVMPTNKIIHELSVRIPKTAIKLEKIVGIGIGVKNKKLDIIFY